MQQSQDLDRIMAHLRRGTVHIESETDLARKLSRSAQTGKPLTVKGGFDPTAPDLHLGHTVLLNKMRQFQELGHRVVFIVGDFTALIGDPTGRNEARKPLSEQQIAANAETYKSQVFKVLDPGKTEIRFNSEWLAPLGTAGIIRLAAHYTVARMLERDDFKKRFHAEAPIGIHEFLYPLLQGYDSVALQADVELGGSDQLFNLLVGRALQRDYGQEPQLVMTVPLLEGTDARMVGGVLTGSKMSKSLGNCIGVTDAPQAQFLKVLGVSDDLMWRFYDLLSERTASDIAAIKAACAAGQMNPRDAKEALAVELVARFHGAAAADEARDAGNRWLRDKVTGPDAIEEHRLEAPPEGLSLLQVLKTVGAAASTGEARRKLGEGAIWLDGRKLEATDTYQLVPGKTYEVRYGKKKILKVTL